MTYTFTIIYTTLTGCKTREYETNQGYIICALNEQKAREKGVEYFKDNNFYMVIYDVETKLISECQVECYLNRNYQDLRDEI